MRRLIAGFHPLVIAAVAGAALGLLGAVLLLRFGDPPGVGTLTRSSEIFARVSLPARWWQAMLFGWVWPGSRESEFLVILPLNGAIWTLALTALVRGLRRSARTRRIAGVSALAGTGLAALVWMAGIPANIPYDGPRELIILAQAPGIILLGFNGYDTFLYDGTFAGEIFRPGPVTLLAFALANTLLMSGFVSVAHFTWRWIRMPMPRRRPVADG